MHDTYCDTDTVTDYHETSTEQCLTISEYVANTKVIYRTLDKHEIMQWMDQFNNEPCESTSNKQLPWIEKYRPKTLDEIMGHVRTVEIMKKFVAIRQMPHVLLYGPSGTGKTSIIRAFSRELYGKYHNIMVLELNASEERGVEVVRNKIKDFIVTKGSFVTDYKLFKLVILDEADAMTIDAQSMLRSVIEKYSENVRFCLVCNHIKKINPAIQSRCVVFKFSPVSKTYVMNKLREIIDINNIKITENSLNTIIENSKGDLRKAINTLHSSSLTYDVINNKKLIKCFGYVSNDDIKLIYKILLTQKIKDAYKNIKEITTKNFYTINDIITCISNIMITDFLTTQSIDQATFCNITINLCQIEMNLLSCPNEDIQIASLISVFHVVPKN